MTRSFQQKSIHSFQRFVDDISNSDILLFNLTVSKKTTLFNVVFVDTVDVHWTISQRKSERYIEVFRLRHFENKAIVFAEHRLEAAGLCFAENVGFNPGLRGPTSRSFWKSFKLDPCLFPNWNAWKIERKETRQLSPSG